MRKGKGIVGIVNKNEEVKRKKMKKKTLVLIGIAVCIILLTAPALASAGYSKIYGNANEDDVLDMRDVTYIKLVIFGKKPATTFADANYDGKISMLDVGQTKLIILDKEKKLTLVDMADRTVTINKPIERVVTIKPDDTRIIVALGGCDKLVGVDRHMRMDYCICHGANYEYCPDDSPCKHICGGKFEEYPDLGRGQNLEVIVSLRPDILFAGLTGDSGAKNLEEKTGVPAISTNPSGHDFDKMYEHIEFMGTVQDKEEEAEELISFCEEKIDKVREITSEIPEDEKPTVYFSTRGYSGGMGGFTRTVNRYEPLDIAGGINVAKDVLPEETGSTTIDVSKEQIIKWNPDIIIMASRGEMGGEGTVDLILSDSDLQTVNAVKNRAVYPTPYAYCRGTPADKNLAAAFYLAKLFHPEKFKDMDVEEEGNEIYERFLGVDGLYTEYADLMPWMREWLDSQK